MPATMSEFAKRLNISTTYLRRVCRGLKIEPTVDPQHKSRRLLSDQQQAEVAAKLGRNLTAPKAATVERNEEIITGELVLYPEAVVDYSSGLAVAHQSDTDSQLASQQIDNQMESLFQRIDAFAYEVGQRAALSVTNGINSGLSRGLHNGAAQVPGGK